MNRSESKYFNTAIKIDKAFLSLLETKDFAYITIKEVCAAAGVNRSTFYLHYQNTRELWTKACCSYTGSSSPTFKAEARTSSGGFPTVLWRSCG